MKDLVSQLKTRIKSLDFNRHIKGYETVSKSIIDVANMFLAFEPMTKKYIQADDKVDELMLKFGIDMNQGRKAIANISSKDFEIDDEERSLILISYKNILNSILRGYHVYALAHADKDLDKDTVLKYEIALIDSSAISGADIIFRDIYNVGRRLKHNILNELDIILDKDREVDHTLEELIVLYASNLKDEVMIPNGIEYSEGFKTLLSDYYSIGKKMNEAANQMRMTLPQMNNGPKMNIPKTGGHTVPTGNVIDLSKFKN